MSFARPTLSGSGTSIAWPIRPGRLAKSTLELLRTVGGEDEQDIRILFQSIHLVEKAVEHWFLARSHVVAIARNEIDILDHHYRRLLQAGKTHVLGKHHDLGGGDDQGGVWPGRLFAR
jgi:hypothetical protein